ncbi:MAG: cytochrome-c oxidase, cbb3-type subunit III [Azoarcus sp.]|jgi:cytochrome c oxidase cbb3-type subunit 3|nr:cytochrome-c oxidase, cbb3-type subunit III [Azoarcus sp.]
MADFISSFWDLYVAGLTTFGLLLCIVLMVANMTKQKPGASPQMQGHVWDETLREYNNPLPRWWLILFVGTVVFSIVYLVIYPGFGNRLSTTPENDAGLRKEYADEVKKANEEVGKKFAAYKGTPLLALAGNKEAMETGQRLFLTYCAQCHASSGKGSKGYPNLTDNDWLYGGDPDTIKTSITEGRAGVMTPFAGTLSAEQIEDAANYVLTLSGLDADNASAARGKDVFAANCTVCHGADGKGALSMGAAFGALGAPDLTDGVWLYGNSLEAIKDGITKGRNSGPGSFENRMPAWKEFLGEDKIHILAAYVYSLNKDRK